MEKLSPQTIKIKGEVITPIHIDNGEVYDRLDYFLLGEDWEELQLVDRKWLNFCAKKDKKLFQDIIKSIENGNFVKLEELKIEFYERFGDDFFDEYGIIDEIKIGEQAKNHLLQTGNKKNNGEIKKFARFGVDKEIFILGSTLKGIFRTISLINKVNEKNSYENEKKIHYLEKLDNGEFFKKTFANLLFEDVKIKDLEIMIEQTILKNSSNSKSGIPQILENVVSGKFEIIIKDLRGQLNKEKLESMIKKYSNILIKREEKILNNLDYDEDLIDNLKEKLHLGIFPIKIGMYKKSSAYKIFWDEILSNIGKQAMDGKHWLSLSRKLGIGNKSMNFSENNEPLGWIGLSNIEIIKN